MAFNQIQKLNQTNCKTVQKWIIPNWVETQLDENLVRSQTFEFEMGNSSFISKWKVGFDIVHSFGTESVQPYLKLLELSEPYDQIVTTFDAIILNDTPTSNDAVVEKQMRVGDVLWRETIMWFFQHPSASTLRCLSPDGAITIVINLSVRLTMSPIRECSKKSVKQLSENMANLLCDESLADLKIVTSDQKELFTHKIILQTQNSVFASMFRSELSENTTGTIKIDDITGKTMKIILHYVYSGKLLPEWEDDDTIVEFIYAVEKYQLELVLEMLDEYLGQRTRDVSYTDVQLLNLASKMSLKNAETFLFKRVVEAIINVKNAAELFSIINYHEVAAVPNGDEEFVEALKIFDSILSGEDKSEFSACDFHLLALAKRYGMDNVESKLIQKLKKTAKNLDNSTEFFELFKIQNKKEAYTENMLVRAYTDK